MYCMRLHSFKSSRRISVFHLWSGSFFYLFQERSGFWFFGTYLRRARSEYSRSNEKLLSGKKDANQRCVHDWYSAYRNNQKLSRKGSHCQKHNTSDIFFWQELKNNKIVRQWLALHEKIQGQKQPQSYLNEIKAQALVFNPISVKQRPER
jgi:hypothetical protein